MLACSIEAYVNLFCYNVPFSPLRSPTSSPSSSHFTYAKSSTTLTNISCASISILSFTYALLLLLYTCRPLYLPFSQVCLIPLDPSDSRLRMTSFQAIHAITCFTVGLQPVPLNFGPSFCLFLIWCSYLYSCLLCISCCYSKITNQ
jgi:hypothetical protein